jgi:hypothetical protein
MRELDKIAESLFEKIRSRFEKVSIGDENAKATQDPEKARFINFDYSARDGQSLGNVTVSLIDENSIKVYYSKNVTENLTQPQLDEWFDFLKGIRLFAKRNMMNFDTRDISRQTLNIDDLRQQSKSDSSYKADEITIGESSMYGTRRSSYDRVGETRLIVRHATTIDEEKRGCRTRNIESIFVETPQGERFKLPFTNLTGARAIGQHIAQGGTMFDERAEHIVDLVREMAALRTFVSATRNRVFEDDVTPVMVEAAKRRYQNVRKSLKSMRGPRGYGFYWTGSGLSSDSSDGGIGEDEIKDRLTRRIFDERLEEALPYVRRAYSQYLDSQNTAMGQEFESWANEIAEGTWALPDSDDKLKDLQDLMSKPLKVGVDAEATSVLYGLVGDDRLFDILGDLADRDPEANIWEDPDVIARFEELGIEVKQPEPQPVSMPAQPAAPATQPPMPAQESVSENSDLSILKWLSGLQK